MKEPMTQYDSRWEDSQMKRILVGVFAVMLVIGAVLGFTITRAFAQCADGACTTVVHDAGDTGWNASITVQCADGHSVYVAPGENSQTRAPGRGIGCTDARKVYMHIVSAGQQEEMKCQPDGSSTYVVIAPNAGWNNINWVGYRNCILQLVTPV